MLTKVYKSLLPFMLQRDLASATQNIKGPRTVMGRQRHLRAEESSSAAGGWLLHCLFQIYLILVIYGLREQRQLVSAAV